MGVERIKRNLEIDIDDIVKWCQGQILKKEALIIRRGKNWYIKIDNYCITVNAFSYTIITAHKI